MNDVNRMLCVILADLALNQHYLMLQRMSPKGQIPEWLHKKITCHVHRLNHAARFTATGLKKKQ